MDAAGVEIEPHDFAEKDLTSLLPAQDGPQGASDVGGRQGTRRHLIKQRLKEVKIAAVEQGHLNRGLAQRLSGVQAAEAAADDDDAMRVVHDGYLLPRQRSLATDKLKAE